MELAEYAVGGLHEFIAPEIQRLPRSTPILDLGCGSGAWIARLQQLGFTDLTGIDMNPPDFSFAQFVVANLNSDRPALRRKYGLVTSFEVIEHLENVGGLMGTISDALAPDGFAIITTPNIHSLRSRVKFALTGKLPTFDEKGEPTHITPIWLPALKKVAARYGLSVERAWTYPERGTFTFGRPIRVIAAAARIFAPDSLQGDILCVLLRPGAVDRSSAFFQPPGQTTSRAA